MFSKNSLTIMEIIFLEKIYFISQILFLNKIWKILENEK